MVWAVHKRDVQANDAIAQIRQLGCPALDDHLPSWMHVAVLRLNVNLHRPSRSSLLAAGAPPPLSHPLCMPASECCAIAQQRRRFRLAAVPLCRTVLAKEPDSQRQVLALRRPGLFTSQRAPAWHVFCCSRFLVDGQEIATRKEGWQ